MKNKFSKNWGLKVGSFLFAVVIWVIVTNINDPVIPYKVYDVPVTIKNADLITKNGQIYEILDNSDVIDLVTVTAPRSIIDSLDASNIVAVADMNDLSSVNTVAIKLSTNKYSDKLESIKGSTESLKLSIENKKIKSLPIRTNATGEVKEGYMIGDVTTEQNLIRISGPESVISQISKATAEIDISGFTNNIGTDTEIHLYNDEGVEVVSDNIEKSISRVRINVEILLTKKLPIHVNVTGTPAEGYRFTGETKSTKNYVTVAGRAKTIETLNSVEIREQDVDLTGATEDVSVLVNLSDYLPNGVILAEEDFNGKVNVTAFVESVEELNITVPNSKITILNMPEEFEYEITDPEDELDVVVSGLTKDLEGINSNSLTVSVDMEKWMANEEMEELSAGNYKIPVDITVSNDEVTVKGKTEIRLHITKK